MFHDPFAIGGIGELQAEDLRIFFRLLKPIPWMLINAFCFHDRNCKILPVAKEVVCSLLWASPDFVSRKDNAAICKRFLLTDLFVRPAGSVKLRQYVLATGVCFGKEDHFEK
ncbi:MAG TPA: hypothetical protein VFO39_22615 [Candidatus Sulfotelmatobacter sp.]|nr:hypothetical protein [Candidatus Sulfotelmatobacter sp.]